jgi:hypothetical protein
MQKLADLSDQRKLSEPAPTAALQHHQIMSWEVINQNQLVVGPGLTDAMLWYMSFEMVMSWAAAPYGAFDLKKLRRIANARDYDEAWVKKMLDKTLEQVVRERAMAIERERVARETFERQQRARQSAGLKL